MEPTSRKTALPPTLESVARMENLKSAWERVRKKRSAGGVDGVTVAEFETRAGENLEALSNEIKRGLYVPEPLQYAEQPKPGKTEKRVLGLPSVKNKIVHTALAQLMIDFYNPQFSNCSYAYRIGKGTVKAIGRVRDFLTRKNVWAAPVDIEHFFDTIDHEVCISILGRRVTDEGVIRLVKMYLSNGVLKYDRWEESYDGVPQGGVLSPVLSNIYLNELDQFLHQRKTCFVRYADDLLLLGKTREYLVKEVAYVEDFLKKELKLATHASDDPVVNVSRGFPFLGIFFHRDRVKIDYNRMDQKIDKIRSLLSKRRHLPSVVRKLNDFFTGVRRYYLKVMPENHQLDTLENRVLNELSRFIARGKTEGFIETKKACKKELGRLLFIREKTESQRNILTDKVIEDGFTRYRQKVVKTDRETGAQSVKSAIGKKRQQYAKKIATETELVVSKFGHSVGYTQHKFTVRHKGVVVASIPKEKMKRLVISSPGVSISSNLVHQCCKRNISIEFLSNRGEPYAMIYTPQFSITRSSEKQLSARSTKTGAWLAVQFLKGKSKNQINLLKYFNKYLKRVEEENSRVIQANIDQMVRLSKKFDKRMVRKYKSETFRNQLMGNEGMISQFYWNSVKRILPPDVGFEKRVTYRARDLVNSTLNYGYGILYNRVQQALADAGAALHISFLHEPQAKKPTLVYDLIEEFRQFIVDRSVIAMFNRQEPLNTDNKGFLTHKARQLIVQNVQERLGSYLKWRKKQWKCEEIIFHQARLMMHHLNGDKKYRPFIGRF